MAVSQFIVEILSRYGLGSLAQWASDAIINGLSEGEVLMQLYERPEFHARFPGIKERELSGKPPISPEEYLQYEASMQSLSQMWDLGITKEETDKLISNNVSVREAEERVVIAAGAMFDDASETRGELQRLYGISSGQLIRYWMDPKKSFGVLQQQYRAAQIAGSALRTGFGQINEAQARRLQQAGLDQQQALAGFSTLVQNRGLFESTIATEEAISADQQVELLAGNTEVGQEVERRQRRRLAEYAGGGGFASGEEGFALGSAPT